MRLKGSSKAASANGSHRHAEYYRNHFERAEGEAEARPKWLADYAVEIDNLRAALDWGFSPDGDRSIGVALTTAADPCG
jgi:hypothetical protein